MTASADIWRFDAKSSAEDDFLVASATALRMDPGDNSLANSLIAEMTQHVKDVISSVVAPPNFVIRKLLSSAIPIRVRLLRNEASVYGQQPDGLGLHPR